MQQRLRIAVIGSGVAGLSAAHILGPRHDVVLFEAADRLGGHANTVRVDDPAVGTLSVDTGFIVHNDRNYPNLVRLFQELGVATQPSEMSFAVTDRTRGSGARPFTYRATNLATLAADRRNIVDGRMWRMVGDVLRFYRDGRAFLAAPDPQVTIAEFLHQQGYGPELRDLHLMPMGAAVWSCDPEEFGNFPALSLLRFFDNHGLLGLGDRPQWRTVVGGAKTYVDAIAQRFSGDIRVSCPVSAVEREDAGVIVRSPVGQEAFDRVVMAVHADQALALLVDATPEEKTILGAVRFQDNHAVLHTDTSVLSPVRRAWAAWNYERRDQSVRVTYDLSNLQRLPGSRRYLVSLNSDDMINPALVLGETNYAHPVFDHGTIEAQEGFELIDGVRNTHFAGAWWGYGFHEDGLDSAIRVARRLGVEW